MGNISPEMFQKHLEQPDELREQEIKELLLGLNFKQFSVLIKPSISDYNNISTVSYLAQKVYDFSFKKNNEFLIDRLKTYSSKEDVQMED